MELAASVSPPSGLCVGFLGGRGGGMELIEYSGLSTRTVESLLPRLELLSLKFLSLISMFELISSLIKAKLFTGTFPLIYCALFLVCASGRFRFGNGGGVSPLIMFPLLLFLFCFFNFGGSVFGGGVLGNGGGLSNLSKGSLMDGECCKKEIVL